MHYEVHAQGNYYLTAVNDFLWAMSKIKNKRQIFKWSTNVWLGQNLMLKIKETALLPFMWEKYSF